MEGTIGYYGFFIAGIIGPAIIGYFLISRSLRMRERAKDRDSSFLSRYESTVGILMLVGGIAALCSICLILFTLIFSR
jgi:hypothetical protein